MLGKSAKLPMGRIELTRVKDANHEEPSQAVIQSVEFHPSGQLLLTAGFDKHLRFFQVGFLHSYGLRPRWVITDKT